MAHKRMQVMVAVLVLALMLTALVGSVHAAERSSVELRAEMPVASLNMESGRLWIMGGCEESAGGCPWD